MHGSCKGDTHTSQRTATCTDPYLHLYYLRDLYRDLGISVLHTGLYLNVVDQ